MKEIDGVSLENRRHAGTFRRLCHCAPRLKLLSFARQYSQDFHGWEEQSDERESHTVGFEA
jgi:hypothetical protein